MRHHSEERFAGLRSEYEKGQTQLRCVSAGRLWFSKNFCLSLRTATLKSQHQAEKVTTRISNWLRPETTDTSLSQRRPTQRTIGGDRLDPHLRSPWTWPATAAFESAKRRFQPGSKRFGI